MVADATAGAPLLGAALFGVAGAAALLKGQRAAQARAQRREAEAALVAALQRGPDAEPATEVRLVERLDCPVEQWPARARDLLAAGPRRKLILLARHGMGLHNVVEKAVGDDQWNESESHKELYLDAPLVERGVNQCEHLRRQIDAILEAGGDFDAILVSPLRRAIQTAKAGFAPVWDKLPKYAVESCRERFGNCMSEKRRPTSEIREFFPEVNFDLFMDGEEDTWHRPKRETYPELARRGKRFFSWLMRSPWQNVLVGNHSSFIAHSIRAIGAPDLDIPDNCELVAVVIEEAQ